MKKELEQINGKIEELKVKQDGLSCDSKEYLELLKEQVELEKEKLELIELHKENIEKAINFKIGSMDELDLLLTNVLCIIDSNIQSSSSYNELSKLLSISEFRFGGLEYLEAKNKIDTVKDKLNEKYYKELKSLDTFSYYVKTIYNLLDKMVVKKQFTY